MELKTVQWTVSIFMIVMAIAMFTTADACKRFGIKSCFLLSNAILILGSLVCAFAESSFTLIVGRAIQGFAVGFQMPLGAILVARLYPREKIGLAMGIYGAVMLMAPAMGPVMGGYLVEHYNWQSIFFCQLPLAIFSALLGSLYIPGNKNDAEPKSVNSYDYVGLLLVSVHISTLFAFLAELQEFGISAQFTLLYATLCISSLLFFLANELVAKRPLINLSLFFNLEFSLSLMIILLIGFGLFSSVLIVPYYLQSVLAMPAVDVGKSLIWTGLIMSILAPVCGRLSDTQYLYSLISVGLVLFFISCYLISTSPMGTSVTGIIWLLIIGRIGFSVMLPAIYTNAMRLLKPENIPDGAVLINLFRQIGGTLGVVYISSYYEQTNFIVSSHLTMMFSGEHAKQSTSSNLSLVELEALLHNFSYPINQISGYVAFIEIFRFTAYLALAALFAIAISKIRGTLGRWVQA